MKTFLARIAARRDARRWARIMRRYDREHPCFKADGTRLGQYDGRYGG